MPALYITREVTVNTMWSLLMTILVIRHNIIYLKGVIFKYVEPSDKEFLLKFETAEHGR